MDRPKKYYLYRHIRNDINCPFYIGIGTIDYKRGAGINSLYARAFNKSKSRNAYWKNIINNNTYEIEILFETHDIELIKRKEIEFIKLYGLKHEGGILCNLTYGGDGIAGFSHSEETKKIIGEHSKSWERQKGYKLNISSEGRQAKIDAVKNRIVSEETRQIMSNNLKGNKRGIGHKVSEEQKNHTRLRLYKSIYQFNINGDLIKQFYSININFLSP